jgi:formylmethanofuran dehydrogenase subunit E-like metal-binding protein
MGEYDYRVQRQKVLLEAEEWADGVKSIHVHGITSMYYETAESKADIEKNGQVTDTEYNSGLIVRERNGKEVCTFGIRKTGDDLIDAYLKGQAL